MNSSLLGGLHLQFTKAFEEHKYLNLNSEKLLEVSSNKEIRLNEVYGYAEAEIACAIDAIKSSFAMQADMGKLDGEISLLKLLEIDGDISFQRYQESTNTWTRWILKGLAQHTPGILKWILPACFSNQIAKAEVDTKTEYEAYKDYLKGCIHKIEELKKDQAKTEDLKEVEQKMPQIDAKPISEAKEIPSISLSPPLQSNTVSDQSTTTEQAKDLHSLMPSGGDTAVAEQTLASQNLNSQPEIKLKREVSLEDLLKEANDQEDIQLPKDSITVPEEIQPHQNREKNEKELNGTWGELLKTEKTYKIALEATTKSVKIILNEIIKSHGFINNKMQLRMFLTLYSSEMEKLIKFSSLFYNSFAKCQPENLSLLNHQGIIDSVHEVFNAPYFADYISSVTVIKSLFKEFSSHILEIKKVALEEEVEGDNEKKQMIQTMKKAIFSIEENAICVIQRMPRYEMLIGRCVKNLGELKSNKFEAAEKLSEKIKSDIAKVNGTTKRLAQLQNAMLLNPTFPAVERIEYLLEIVLENHKNPQIFENNIDEIDFNNFFDKLGCIDDKGVNLHEKIYEEIKKRIKYANKTQKKALFNVLKSLHPKIENEKLAKKVSKYLKNHIQ